MINTKLLEKLAYVDIKGLVPKGDVFVSTDTRTIKSNSLYVPLKGANFDAHNFIENALTLGASIVLVETGSEFAKSIETICSKYPDACFILVKDNLIALQELASLRREEWKASGDKLIIGVTGSNGKTTHKEILKFLAERIYPQQVLATAGNLNNHIGLPLTLLSLEDHHKIAIVEAGTNHNGEIELLSDIMSPDTGIITNIGLAHIEFFKTQEAIYVEKTALYRKVKSNGGALVICSDDPMLARLQNDIGIIAYGESSQTNKITKTSNGFKLELGHGDSVEVPNPNIKEWYNLKNIAGCLLLLLNHFAEKRDALIKASCDFVLPNNNRSQWLSLHNGAKVFLDAYNANPSSMKVSLNSFFEILNKDNIKMSEALFVLGDMNELGEFSEKLHEEIGQLLSEHKVLNVYFVGRFSNFYLKGHEQGRTFANTKSAKEVLNSELKKFKYLFIKGSRSLQLESLLDITKG